MSNGERFRPSHFPEVGSPLREDLPTQSAKSLRMEQVVSNLAACSGVDLSEKGASFELDVPNQAQRWLFTNIDGERIGITHGQVAEENLLAPDLDIVVVVTPDGWEPQELIHRETTWNEYEKAAGGRPIPAAQGNFSFAAFTDHIAEQLEQQAGIKEVTQRQEYAAVPFTVAQKGIQNRQQKQPDFAQWPDTGVPPLAGGSPRKKDPQGGETPEMSREEAKAYIENFFARKWNRRKEEKEIHRTLKEINRLNRLYPGLRDEVVADALEQDPTFVDYIAAMKERGEAPDIAPWQAPQEIKKRFGL